MEPRGGAAPQTIRKYIGGLRELSPQLILLTHNDTTTTTTVTKSFALSLRF